MPKALPITLSPGEHVAAVVPERCSGPGWGNSPIWVHIHNNGAGTFRTECIQPDERTPGLHALFGIGAEVCATLIGAVPTNRKKNA